MSPTISWSDYPAPSEAPQMQAVREDAYGNRVEVNENFPFPEKPWPSEVTQSHAHEPGGTAE